MRTPTRKLSTAERIIIASRLHQHGYKPHHAFKLANHPRHTLTTIDELIQQKIVRTKKHA